MPEPTTRRPPSLATMLLLGLLVALVLTLFAWPASRLEPRDLPVGVAGPAASVQAIEHQLSARDGAFEVHRYGDEAAARRAVEDRRVYGAFVATPAGPEVLTATGASPMVAQLLAQVAQGGHGSADGKARVVDLAPAAQDDPRGSGLSSTVLPLMLAGVLIGMVASMLAPGLRRRAALVAVGSVVAGLAAVGVAQGWLGVVEHDWAANWAVLSLTVLSVASLVAGLHALLGQVGIAVGSLTMILLGNPFSAASSAPEMLPHPVGFIGQLMPPGASVNALRSTAFFDGAGAGAHLAVLATWVGIGAAALLVAAARRRRATAPTSLVPRPSLALEGSVSR